MKGYIDESLKTNLKAYFVHSWKRHSAEEQLQIRALSPATFGAATMVSINFESHSWKIRYGAFDA